MIIAVDDQAPDGVPDGLRSAMEPLVDLSRRVAEAIRSATLSGPGGLAGSDLLIRYAEQVSAVPRMWAGAAAVIEPILTYAARVSDVTDSWIDLLRPRDDAS